MTKPDYCPVAQEPCQLMCVTSDVRCKIRDAAQPAPVQECFWRREGYKECPAAQPAPVQEPVATLWQHGETGRTRITMPGDITDCDARWFKAADLYTTPPAQPAPVQAVEPVEATDEIIFHGLEAFNRRTHKTYGTGNTRKLTPEERMTRAYYAMRVGIIQPAAQQEMTVVDPADWVPCTPEWINQGGDCAKSPRVWNAKECNHYHPATPPAAPVQPVAWSDAKQ